MGIIKMENDVDVQSEKESIGMVSDEVHLQSTLSIKEDEIEIMNIKLEDFADTHEEEDPLGELPLIKSEHEVSFTFLCTFKKYVGLRVLCLLSIST
ncbi:hypothetical protein L798_01971 [Zootermopsis nevadensis]|uniref:Uncharacterized protein n=2 Tax=Zootermopsis nevadensis TaxID=136037 RepID=A0A067QSP4_ZOONE|nr:hypothetical protein L798_01971 [Zootermopsis nevadensis]